VSIPVVAYGPVGRGWLSGKFRTPDDLPKDPFRSTLDRFKPEFFEKNSKLVEAVENLAKRKDLKTSQVAIAWVARQGAIPIPGSTNIDRISLNSKLQTLSDEDMAELQKIIDKFPVGGGRYNKAHGKLLNG
jgi:pyridoxine 4-dehydrogenase